MIGKFVISEEKKSDDGMEIKKQDIIIPAVLAGLSLIRSPYGMLSLSGIVGAIVTFVVVFGALKLWDYASEKMKKKK